MPVSMAEMAYAVVQYGENGLPAGPLRAVYDELDAARGSILGLTGETQNEFIHQALRQLDAAKQSVYNAQAALEGCKESLISYGRWVLGGG